MKQAAESVNSSDVTAKLREIVHLFPSPSLPSSVPLDRFGQDIPMKENVQLL
jgi:hypothetical protein